jgi:hypothetical protein
LVIKQVSSIFFLVVLAFCLSVSLTLALPAQSQNPRTEDNQSRSSRPKQSTVRGRVIYEDTRRPLRRVQLIIWDPASKTRMLSYDVWTDGNGEFQIVDVPAGQYFIDVSAPGIIHPGVSDENGAGALTTVTVDGTSTVEVVVRVKRGGAISGKVTYADGDPAINASVRIFRKREGKWTQVIGRRSEDAITDERGIYRVSGLWPGEYVVGAAEQKWSVELNAQDKPDAPHLLNRSALGISYYDGANTMTSATLLTIQAGQEQTDINITLADRPVHSISGTVVLKGSTRAVGRARVNLKRKDEGPAVRSDLEDPVTNTDLDGHFNFTEVEDGSYTMIITSPRWISRGDDFPTATQISDAGQRFAPRKLEITVSGANLADIMIEVSSGSRISGTVTADGGKPLPATVLVYALGEVRQADTATPIRVQTDGTFSIEGVPPGPIYLRTSIPPNGGYFTKSVTAGKRELARGPLVVREGEDVNDVRIVISPEVALLSGRVIASDGKTPVAGVTVVLISADPDQQKSTSRLYGMTNADGTFRLSGGPGEYLAIVMGPNESDDELSNEALRTRAPKVQRIVLQAGENKIEIVAPPHK